MPSIRPLTPRQMLSTAPAQGPGKPRVLPPKGAQLVAPRLDYPGLELPDVTVARQWRPGKVMLDGAAANRWVTETYTQLDKGMTQYLGEPAVPNWMSFGKYASREAGGQILRMEEVLKITQGLDADSLVDSVQDMARNPALLGEQGLQLFRLSGGNPVTFLRHTERMHKALVFGNTGVYADLAPAYDLFLRAEAAGTDGVAALKRAGFGRAPRDPQGLLLDAFKLYSESRRVRDQAAVLGDGPERDKLLERRQALIHRANLLLGTHEQMVILQGPEVFGDPEVARLLSRMTASATITDALGTHRLLPNGGNWANFDERMGFLAVPAGSDPQAVKVVDHAGVTHHYVMHPDPQRREGSIGQYFLDGLPEENARKMIAGEPTPLPESYRDGDDVKRWFDWIVAAPGKLIGKLWDKLSGPFRKTPPVPPSLVIEV